VGAQYVPSFGLLAILGVHFIQWTWNYVFVILLTGLGFIRERVAIVISFGVLNVILSVGLTFSFGLIGVVVGLFVSMLITQSWFLTWVIFKRAHWIFDKKAA
jgi:O-antigen/teichoic acid export membrane protein